VGTLDAWHVVWHQSPLYVAYRQQRHTTRTPELLSVWLREGQRAVEYRECQPFDAIKLRESIPLLRQLTTQTPAEFWPTLETLCANAGVCLVQVAPYPKLAAYGATYRYRGKTVLQVSNHRRTVDQFWFTFFHEVGHLLLHGIKEFYIDGEVTDDTQAPTVAQEREADAFAARTLIPEGAWNTYVARAERALREDKVAYQLADIERFAAQQGIDAGIVIGRLQHEKRIPYQSVLNHHKQSLVWE
jgi:HTH-type transcriptional regulator/antitoxin HigA